MNKNILLKKIEDIENQIKLLNDKKDKLLKELNNPVTIYSLSQERNKILTKMNNDFEEAKFNNINLKKSLFMKPYFEQVKIINDNMKLLEEGKKIKNIQIKEIKKDNILLPISNKIIKKTFKKINKKNIIVSSRLKVLNKNNYFLSQNLEAIHNLYKKLYKNKFGNKRPALRRKPIKYIYENGKIMESDYIMTKNMYWTLLIHQIKYLYDNDNKNIIIKLEDKKKYNIKDKAQLWKEYKELYKKKYNKIRGFPVNQSNKKIQIIKALELLKQ